MVAGRLAHGIHRSTLAVGNLLHVFDGTLVDEQAHALLRLVGYYLLSREGLVADRQLVHVDESAALLYQLRQTVDVSSRAVIVDGDDRILVLLAESADYVISTLLHLRVGTLYGVQLDTARVATCLYGRYGTAAETDAVVLTTHHNNLVAWLRFALQAVALQTVAYAAGQHDNLVVGVLLALLLVLEGEHGTADERLAELVAEVGRTVGSLDKYLLRCLVEPLAHGQYLLPSLVGALLAWI